MQWEINTKHFYHGGKVASKEKSNEEIEKVIYELFLEYVNLL